MSLDLSKPSSSRKRRSSLLMLNAFRNLPGPRILTRLSLPQRSDWGSVDLTPGPVCTAELTSHATLCSHASAHSAQDPAEAEAAEADAKPEAPPSAAAPAPSPAAELPVKDETVDDDEPAVQDPTPILLSSWYPSIGFPALLLFIMPFLSPEWAHPLPEPDFDAITRFTPCTSHLHCGKIKTCPGEGMKELE